MEWGDGAEDSWSSAGAGAEPDWSAATWSSGVDWSVATWSTEATGPVAVFLQAAGLEKFVYKFAEDGFDSMDLLTNLEDTDLVEMGLAKGHILKFRNMEASLLDTQEWDQKKEKKEKKEKENKKEKKADAWEAEPAEPVKTNKPKKKVNVSIDLTTPYSGVVRVRDDVSGDLLIDCEPVTQAFGRPAKIPARENRMGARIGSVVCFKVAIDENNRPTATQIMINGFEAIEGSESLAMPSSDSEEEANTFKGKGKGYDAFKGTPQGKTKGFKADGKGQKHGNGKADGKGTPQGKTKGFKADGKGFKADGKAAGKVQATCKSTSKSCGKAPGKSKSATLGKSGSSCMFKGVRS